MKVVSGSQESHIPQRRFYCCDGADCQDTARSGFKLRPLRQVLPAALSEQKTLIQPAGSGHRLFLLSRRALRTEETSPAAEEFDVLGATGNGELSRLGLVASCCPGLFRPGCNSSNCAVQCTR